MSINDDLDLLANYLEGLNYTVFLQCYTVEHQRGESETQIVQSALPDAVLSRIVQTDAATILRKVQRDITYTGDYSHGPQKDVLVAEGYKTLLTKCHNHIQAMLNGADSCWEIGIGDGHPAYPVFWDFAYLIRHGSNSYVLIGSSSD